MWHLGCPGEAREPQEAPVTLDLSVWVWTGHSTSFLQCLTLSLTLDLVNDAPEPALHLLAL